MRSLPPTSIRCISRRRQTSRPVAISRHITYCAPSRGVCPVSANPRPRTSTTTSSRSPPPWREACAAWAGRRSGRSSASPARCAVASPCPGSNRSSSAREAEMNFREELTRLDRLIHREILRLRAAYQLSLDEYRGVYISDEQVDALVAESKPLGDIADPIAKLTRDAEAIAERIGHDSPVGRIAQTLGLDGFARDVLLVAIAPELHLKYETLYAYLNNHASRPFPTIDLAL